MGRRKSCCQLKEARRRFKEAESAFADSLASVFLDEDHSIEEKREIIIGFSERQQLLVISFTERADDIIRIIKLSNRNVGTKNA